jgi:hypothetical protein
VEAVTCGGKVTITYIHKHHHFDMRHVPGLAATMKKRNKWKFKVALQGPCRRRLVADVSQRRFGFAPRLVRVGFSWTMWHWDKLISEFFCFSPVDITPPSFSILIGPLVAAVQRYIFTPLS